MRENLWSVRGGGGEGDHTVFRKRPKNESIVIGNVTVPNPFRMEIGPIFLSSLSYGKKP